MDTNFLYTIDAQAAWNYEQLLLNAQLYKQQSKQHQYRDYIQTKIDDRQAELEAAITSGEILKQQQQQQQQQDSLDIQKQIFRNEKDQETARHRLYLAQDRLKRFDLATQKQKQPQKSPAQRRRSTKNYIDELFEKAQLNVAVGNVQNVPSRRRYSIPRTIRE
jgi:hypothetical protein